MLFCDVSQIDDPTCSVMGSKLLDEMTCSVTDMGSHIDDPTMLFRVKLRERS